MQVDFYKFKKRENSTKQPTGAAAASYQCVLKTPCSIVDPDMIIKIPAGASPDWPDYNYAHIPLFNRYYYVADVVADAGLWNISMKCDVLASYKTEIGNASTYVLRSAAAWNGNIIDEYYPIISGVTEHVTFQNSPWMQAARSDIDIETDGCFVVGLISTIPIVGSLVYYPAYGSITYRAFTRENLQKMVNFLLSNQAIGDNVNGFRDTVDVSIALQRAIIDPLSFIKSCTWVPVPYATITSQQETPDTSIWDFTMTGVASKALNNAMPYKTISRSIPITKHPDAATRGNYLNLEPYTKLSLFAPPFGLLNLDTTLAADETDVDLEFCIDLITGLGTLIVYIGATQTHYLKTQVGVPIQLSQVTNDIGGSIISGVGGFVAGAIGALTGNVAALFGGAAAMVGSVANAIKPNVSSMGGSGAFSDLRGMLSLIHEFRSQAPENLAEVGRPLCDTRQISTLPGYNKCIGDIPIDGTSGEQAAVKSYLEGGFFYE